MGGLQVSVLLQAFVQVEIQSRRAFWTLLQFGSLTRAGVFLCHRDPV